MAFYWWWTVQRPWDRSQIILKRSKTYIVWIFFKCDFNKCSRFTFAPCYCLRKWKQCLLSLGSSSLIFIAGSSDTGDLSEPLTSDHDTQRPVWRQERDAQRLEVPLVHDRPRRRQMSGRDAAPQHWPSRRVPRRGRGQGWVEGHRTCLVCRPRSPKVPMCEIWWDNGTTALLNPSFPIACAAPQLFLFNSVLRQWLKTRVSKNSLCLDKVWGTKDRSQLDLGGE